jgi:hypothetical protein
MGLQLERAFEIVRKTLPYFMHRAVIYGVLCLCVILYLGLLTVVGIVFGVGAFWALFIFSAFLVTAGGVGNFLSQYLFLWRRAGHVALMTEIITEGQLPNGISHTKWASGRVLHYFRSAGVLSEIRRLMRETLKAIHLNLVNVGGALPIPGVEGKARITQHLVSLSQSYIEEAGIAYVFRARDENVFASTRAALLSYTQCWKPVLTHAVTLTLLGYCVTLLASVLFLVPLGVLAVSPFHEWISVRFLLFTIGVFMGLCVKWILFDPLANAVTILTFFGESDVSAPDPEMDAKLCEISPAYLELLQREQEIFGSHKNNSQESSDAES